MHIYNSIWYNKNKKRMAKVTFTSNHSNITSLGGLFAIHFGGASNPNDIM